MSFVSFSFILFSVCLFAAYFAAGRLLPRCQWLVLLAASAVFYVSTMKWLSLYLLFAVVVSWAASLGMQCAEEKKRKAYLVICLVLILGVLVLLKCRGVLRIDRERFSWLVMPLGISFFTFLSIGYTIDVYRGTVEAEKNPLKYALYVSFFPHVTQGPLDRYAQLSPQLLTPHRFDLQNMRNGLERMLLGYFKKLIIADNLGRFVQSIYSEPESFSGIILAFATLMYAFQLYADFSGYMDIACGISECLGIRLEENFETPYFSGSIAEYWRRWHSSLGAWFRDYLYYSVLRSGPVMKLSKKLRKAGHKKASKDLTAAIGLFCTWLLIGFWHGASGNFIAHGLFHGSIIILSTVLADFYTSCRERLGIREKSKLWKFFRMARTFLLVNIGYVLFRSDSLQTAMLIYRRILTQNFYFGWSHGLLNPEFDWFFWICMAAALAFCFLIEIIETKEHFIPWLNRQKLPVRWAFLYGMMLSVACVLLFSDAQEVASGNFLYFNF